MTEQLTLKRSPKNTSFSMQVKDLEAFHKVWNFFEKHINGDHNPANIDRSYEQVLDTFMMGGVVTLEDQSGEIIGIGCMHDLGKTTSIPGYFDEADQPLDRPLEYGSVFIVDNYQGKELYGYLAAARVGMAIDPDIYENHRDCVSAGHGEAVEKTYSSAGFPVVEHSDQKNGKLVVRADMQSPSQQAKFASYFLKKMGQLTTKDESIEIKLSTEVDQLAEQAKEFLDTCQQQGYGKTNA